MRDCVLLRQALALNVCSLEAALTKSPALYLQDPTVVLSCARRILAREPSNKWAVAFQAADGMISDVADTDLWSSYGFPIKLVRFQK
jgi:hypothetical protein